MKKSSTSEIYRDFYRVHWYWLQSSEGGIMQYTNPVLSTQSKNLLLKKMIFIGICNCKMTCFSTMALFLLLLWKKISQMSNAKVHSTEMCVIKLKESTF